MLERPKTPPRPVPVSRLAAVNSSPLTTRGCQGRRAAGVIARVSRVTRQVAHPAAQASTRLSH
jgi:hypothetical protein